VPLNVNKANKRPMALLDSDDAATLVRAAKALGKPTAIPRTSALSWSSKMLEMDRAEITRYSKMISPRVLFKLPSAMSHFALRP
jgi:hypothetical protein